MDQMEEQGGALRDKVSDTVSEVKENVAGMGRTAAQKIDENRDAAASGLEKAASAIEDKAGALPGGEKVNDLANVTADKLRSTADYVRQNNWNAMMADVQEVVKNNPGPSLLAAVAVGFLVGRAFTRND